MNEKLPGMTPDEFRRMTENGAKAWAGVDPAELRADVAALPVQAEPQDPEGLAHQIYSAAQLAPGEGVTDAVDRIAALLGAAAQEPLHIPAIRLTRDIYGLCVVALCIDGQEVPVIRDGGDFISHYVESSGIEGALRAHGIGTGAAK